jgi:hypothetical protein
MTKYHVDFTRVVRYSATVEAESAGEAGVLVGDVIRAETHLVGNLNVGGNPEIEVSDEGLGEMSVRRVRQIPDSQRQLPILDVP